MSTNQQRWSNRIYSSILYLLLLTISLREQIFDSFVEFLFLFQRILSNSHFVIISENKQQESTDDQPKKSNQCHLWVSNIAKETHASDLKDLFSKHGKVIKISFTIIVSLEFYTIGINN